MARFRNLAIVMGMVACGSFLGYQTMSAGELQPATQAAPAGADSAAPPQPLPPQEAKPNGAGPMGKLLVTVGKSLIIDSPIDIRRVSVANGTLAEAVAVNPKEVLINGLAPGETSLIVWQQSGARLVYDLTVRMSGLKLDSVRQQVGRDFPSENINVTFENDTAFVRGTVKDLMAAERVMAIAATLGKTVNLLRVEVPGIEPQVLLRVRFANVDRSAATDLGVNLASGAFNQNTALGTGSPISLNGGLTSAISSAVNLFLFRRDINLTAAIQALQSKRQLQLLAEPNLLAISGQAASFLAGGEFPVPVVQPGQGQSAISIMWREYGIRLGFLPTVTPRGTIRLKVSPEVSSLDYANAVTVQGVTVPGMSTRRVQTEVELESGQTFVIAGLLDNQTSDSFSKVPGIGSIPVLGKLFQTKNTTRHNSELLVIITPEVVRPIPAGQPAPDITFPDQFLPSKETAAQLSHPGMDKTGPVPVVPPVDSIPVEQLMPKPISGAPPTAFQMIPVTQQEGPPVVNPGIAPPPIPVPRTGGGK